MRPRAKSAPPARGGTMASAALAVGENDDVRVKPLPVAQRLAAAEAEIASLRNELALQRTAFQRVGAAYEARHLALRRTLAWRLGELLVQGFRSPGTIAALPGKLLALRREFNQRKAQRERAWRELGGEALERLVALHAAGGLAAASAAIDELAAGDAAKRAEAYGALARAIVNHDPAAAQLAAQASFDADPQPHRAVWLAFRLFDAGLLNEPARLLESLPADAFYGEAERRRAEVIQAQARALQSPPIVPRRAEPAYVPQPDRLLYVAASGRPHHYTGYTARTQALVLALGQAGLDVRVVTRPGYPWDRSDFSGVAGEASQSDGVTYHHARQPDQHLPMDAYAWRAADVIAAAATEHRAAVIHAASNHVNALPALLAARRLGIPFHYEMRGLWDLSRASKQPGYEHSERFALGEALECHVAANADLLWVISRALADYVAQRADLSGKPVRILPNGIDPAEVADVLAEPPAVFTLGYAGALVPYEGLDLLIDAIGRLHARGMAIEADIMGEGESGDALQSRARNLGLEGVVRFHGRVSPQEAQQRLARTSMICLPRRPSTVCEIVPPLKLVEAMALGVPLLVPDLPVFRDEAEEGRTARFFRAGDLESLVGVLESCAAARDDLLEMGRTARRHALEHRGWQAHAEGIAAAVAAANGPTPGNGQR